MLWAEAGGEGTGRLLRVLRSHSLELPTVQSVPKDQLSPGARLCRWSQGPASEHVPLRDTMSLRAGEPVARASFQQVAGVDCPHFPASQELSRGVASGL